ncbi:MAG: hypothetical protein AAGB12_10465 [Pseudomonadota bacterium]
MNRLLIVLIFFLFCSKIIGQSNIDLTSCSINELAEKSQKIHDKYLKLLPEVDDRAVSHKELLEPCNFGVKELNNKQLHKLYLVISDFAHISYSEKSIVLLNTIFQEKVVRNENVSLLAKNLAQRFFNARHFEKAKLLNETYNLGLNFPKVVRTQNTKHNRTVLKYENEILTEKPFELAKGEQILIVVHPNCGPSRRFEKALAEDPVIKKRFANAILIRAQGGSFAFNKNHLTVFRDADWPEIPDWATPSFYYFKDGKLVNKHFGFKDGKLVENTSE